MSLLCQVFQEFDGVSFTLLFCGGPRLKCHLHIVVGLSLRIGRVKPGCLPELLYCKWRETQCNLDISV